MRPIGEAGQSRVRGDIGRCRPCVESLSARNRTGCHYGLRDFDAVDVLWALATLMSGTCYAGWFAMRSERRHGIALKFFVFGPLPLLVVGIPWAITTLEGLAVRLPVTMLIGALAGACILAAATESLRPLISGNDASTGTPASHSDIADERHSASPAGNFNFGQTGGTTNQTYTNGPK
jgi:hypothetical protein